MDTIEFLAGIDWGSQAHQVCILDGDGGVLGEQSFEHSGGGLARMADWIQKRTGARPQATGIAIEVPNGPVVETMMERGFVLHSLNPRQLDRFRDRFSPAGAKDDRRDALVLADALRTDPKAFRRLDPAAPQIIELREWTRIADHLTGDRTRLANRARQQLWRYYPQLLKVEGDLGRAWIRQVWSLAPTPAKARRVRLASIAALLKRNRIRRIDAETVLRILREPAVPVAPGTAEAAAAHLKLVFAQLDLICGQIAEAHRQMDRLIEALPGHQAAHAAPNEDPGSSRPEPDALSGHLLELAQHSRTTSLELNRIPLQPGGLVRTNLTCQIDNFKESALVGLTVDPQGQPRHESTTVAQDEIQQGK